MRVSWGCIKVLIGGDENLSLFRPADILRLFFISLVLMNDANRGFSPAVWSRTGWWMTEQEEHDGDFN